MTTSSTTEILSKAKVVLAAGLATTLFCLTLFATNASAAFTFPAAQTLSAAGQTASYSQVAVDSLGRATIVWFRFDGSKNRIQSVRLAADGTPGTVQTLSDPGQNAEYPQVAIDSSDRATVTWHRSDGSTNRVQAVRLAADGTPGTVQTLSEAGHDGDYTHLAIDSSDRATITWSFDDLSKYRIQSVRLAADGTPGTVQTLSDSGQNAVGGQVAIDSAGRSTIVWQRTDGSNNRVQSVRLAADGTPGTVQTLSEAGRNALDPEVAIDSSDRATITWSRSDGSAFRIQSVRLAADGTPGTVQTISDAGQSASSPDVATDSSGRATISWSRGGRIQSIRLAADGTPGTVQTISDAGQNADDSRVAIDSSGRPTVTWHRFDGSRYRIQATRAVITQPETTITSGPEGQTNSSNPSFGFSSDTVGATFECHLDSEPFAPCTSPKPYSGLVDGPHTFAVRALDADGPDLTPATRTFTVDTGPTDATPPDTTINSGPSGTIETSQATFTFAGVPANDTAKIQCRIDAGAFADCASPKTFTGLAVGPHTVTFRAEDAAGNQDQTPATRDFTVNTVAPAQATISKVKVSGPKKVKKGKKAIYKVRITNSGNAAATGVKLKASGKGVKAKVSGGTIAAGKTKTVKIKLKPKKTGRIKVTFKVTSGNAGGKTVKKTITVKK